MLPAITSGSFQQLVAVPLEQYSQMSSQMRVHQAPLAQKLAQLQSELASAPTVQSNPYDQMMRQGMRLEAVKRTKEQLQNDISLGTPKPYRNRALALYNQIAPTTHFNEKGELVLLDDATSPSPIVGSRAEDLIQHAVRDRQKQFTPTGWQHFVRQLHKHNIPRMMLNRSTIAELNALADATTPPTTATTTPTPSKPLSPPSVGPPKRRKVSPTKRGRQHPMATRRHKRKLSLGKSFLHDFEIGWES